MTIATETIGSLVKKCFNDDMDFTVQLNQAEEHLTANDEKLAPFVAKYRPCRIKPHSDHYGELISSIAGQQLSVKAADAIWKRVLSIFNNKLPTPEQLLAADTEQLRGCGLSYSKVRYMKDLASHIIEGKLDLAHVSSMPNDELIEQLTAVKGIGEWSAHMFMIFSLGRLDILPVGDLGVRKAAMQLYELPIMPDRDALEKIAKNYSWAPYQSVAAWYLWQSLDNSPEKRP